MNELGRMRGLIGTAAALLFIVAGVLMIDLESVSGNTVAESFYNSMGWFSFGMAALALLVTLPSKVAIQRES